MQRRQKPLVTFHAITAARSYLDAAYISPDKQVFYMYRYRVTVAASLLNSLVNHDLIGPLCISQL